MIPDNANIVVLASNYNPSIVSKEWLLKKEIFTDQVKNFVHTPVFSMVENDVFGFVLEEKRLQVIVKKVSTKNLEISCNMVKLFVDALPETPYKSIGLNYNYILPKDDLDLGTVLSAKNKNIRDIFSPQFELGTVVLFAFEKFVVNFSMSPSLTDDKTRLVFNFHSDLSNIEDIKKCLALQPSTLTKAGDIVKRLSK